MYNASIKDILYCLMISKRGMSNIPSKLAELVAANENDKIRLWLYKANAASKDLRDEDCRFIFIKAVNEILREVNEDEYVRWSRLFDSSKDSLKRTVAYLENNLNKVKISDIKGEIETMLCLLPNGKYTMNDFEYGSVQDQVNKVIQLATDFSYYINRPRERGELEKLQGKQDKAILYKVVNMKQVGPRKLLKAIKDFHMEEGMNIFDNWTRYCNLIQAWYTYIWKLKKSPNEAGETRNMVMDEVAFNDLFSSDEVGYFAATWLPVYDHPNDTSNAEVFQKESAVNIVYKAVKGVNSLSDSTTLDNIVELTTNLMALGANFWEESHRRKLIRFMSVAVNWNSADDNGKYAKAAEQVIKSAVSVLKDNEVDVTRLLV